MSPMQYKRKTTSELEMHLKKKITYYVIDSDESECSEVDYESEIDYELESDFDPEEYINSDSEVEESESEFGEFMSESESETEYEQYISDITGLLFKYSNINQNESEIITDNDYDNFILESFIDFNNDLSLSY